MPTDTYLRKILGDEALTRIQNSRVLMVGAGGIGCELLKNLVLSGYRHIHVVDLDTVTLSNLNRQFLFRHKDIDESKSLTIATAVSSFNYFGAEITPHHGNIMDVDLFTISWWSLFDHVFNALDNLEARRYVNKMVHYTRTPLLESGTAGFDGQILPIYPYASECFDCLPKQTPKTFPVCTIRLTPSQPVHCITWAKEFMFRLLFGAQESNEQPPSNTQQPKVGTVEAAETVLTAEANEAQDNELAGLRSAFMQDLVWDFFDKLVHKLFVVDIERLLLIDSLWATRPRPVPLDWAKLKHPVKKMVLKSDVGHTVSDTIVGLIQENLQVLYCGCKELCDRKSALDGPYSVSFDKDDFPTLQVVAAAANLRSFVFGIDVKSIFDIKEIAGNIIPAIATTNAIIAGFSVLAGTRFFAQSLFDEREQSLVFISIRSNKYVTSATITAPSERCPTSALVARGILGVPPRPLQYTLGELANQIADQYGYDLEAISISTGHSRLVFDVDFTDNASLPLWDVPGFSAGCQIFVQDDNDELEGLELYISVLDSGERTPQLPQLTLRPKKVFSESNTENEGQKGDPEPNKIDGDDVINLDGNDEDDVLEIERPLKKQRVK